VKPLCIDLYAGLGGWTDGFLAGGWDCVGFDIERHVYGTHQYPAQLVLQDVRTLHGSQFKDAQMIVASSPCQEFSYRAMPWKRAKALGPPLLGMELFAQAERIQREAIAAAGHHIPMIQENVRGAQKYVGRAQWHYGSYYLWGDVPALMPVTTRAQKANPDGTAHGSGSWFAIADSKNRGAKNTGAHREISAAWRDKHYDETAKADHQKNTGGSWFAIGSPGQKVVGQNPDGRPIKNGGDWFGSGTDCSLQQDLQRRASSGSTSRKAASARIAMIPFALASHIAHVYRAAPPEGQP
jgi:hypothetical protein